MTSKFYKTISKAFYEIAKVADELGNNNKMIINKI